MHSVCLNNCANTIDMHRKFTVQLICFTSTFCAGLLATFTLLYIANDEVSLTFIPPCISLYYKRVQLPLHPLNKVQTAVSVVDALYGV